MEGIPHIIHKMPERCPIDGTFELTVRCNLHCKICLLYTSYKNTFSVTFDVDPEICSYCTVKPILQPILENAINYGVSGMDDCGEIRVKGRMEEGRVILSVEDNGIGMSEEQVRLLPVSYTHLDVYKRQVYCHSSGVHRTLYHYTDRPRITASYI